MIRAWRFGWRTLKLNLYRAVILLPIFHFIRAYEGKDGPITFQTWFLQKIIGFNRQAYWGVHFTSRVVGHKNIVVGVDSNPGIEPGCYIQGGGRVEIGDYTRVATNVSIISANHDVYDISLHVPGGVLIGDFCWLGAGVVVLPGVKLGNFTVVGAGSVVTKSFPGGYCVIAGNPAKKVRDLDPDKCIKTKSCNEYVGYIRKNDFEKFRKENLWI